MWAFLRAGRRTAHRHSTHHFPPSPGRGSPTRRETTTHRDHFPTCVLKCPLVPRTTSHTIHHKSVSLQPQEPTASRSGEESLASRSCPQPLPSISSGASQPTEQTRPDLSLFSLPSSRAYRCSTNSTHSRWVGPQEFQTPCSWTASSTVSGSRESFSFSLLPPATNSIPQLLLQTPLASRVGPQVLLPTRKAVGSSAPPPSRENAKNTKQERSRWRSL